MPSARVNMSGKRHATATAWNAPIDAPVDQMPMSSDLQSRRMAGTTSLLMYWWNWWVIHMRCSVLPSLLNQTRPATLSHEYILMRPAASSGSSARIMRKRSISPASPPAVGNMRTGWPA